MVFHNTTCIYAYKCDYFDLVHIHILINILMYLIVWQDKCANIVSAFGLWGGFGYQNKHI